MDEQPRHAAPATAGPGDRLVQLGAALFLLGLVGVLGVVVPYFLEREDRAVFSVLSALAPVGLALALVGLLRAARAGRRAGS